MNWPILAVLSALLYSLSNAITKMFQPKLSTGLGMFIFSTGVFLASALIAIGMKSGGITPKFSLPPAYLAIISGIVWAFAQLLLIVTFSKDAPISIAVPIIVGGIAVGGVLTGLVFFGETLSFMRIIGIVTVLIGTVILSR